MQYFSIFANLKFRTKELHTMKKLFFLFAVGALMFAQPTTTFAEEAQTEATSEVQEEEEDTAAAMEEAAPEVEAEEPVQASGNQFIKEKFIEGDPRFMSLVLLTLILGLAIAIERVITIFLSSINTKKFVAEVETLIKTQGVEAAKEKCRNTKGPIASIFYQGLDRVDEGIENVEKAVISYGSVKVGELEKGLVWIALFIALAPMLGFMGTVIGMIFAFDDIEREGDISPALVARGIKLALLTTVAGLVVAIILQIFYNLIMSKIDSLSNEMEDASISLVDILIKNKIVK
jgi:biopolymer transport protein ExbB